MIHRKLLLMVPFALLIASCNQDPKAQAQRYLNNGNKFFDKGKYKEASIMYRRALQKDMKYGDAYYRLGLTEVKLLAIGDAARALRRAVELQPNNVDAANKLAEIYLIASSQDAAACQGSAHGGAGAGAEAAAVQSQLLRRASSARAARLAR